MTQKFRVVYNNADKVVVGLLADDLSKETHEANSPEGIKVTDNILTFDNDNEIITLDKVRVTGTGQAEKV
jgi:hypothetical protein